MPKMDDGRDYVRVSTNLPDHPKLVELANPALAGWLYVVGLTMAGEHLTDGHIVPAAAVRKAGVPARWSKELVRVGLWHQQGHDCPSCPDPAPGKVVIHDYLQHQRSRADAEASRAQRRAAAQSRWGAPRTGEPDAGRNAGRTAGSNARGSAGRNAKPDASRNAEVEGEVEGELPPTGVVGGSDPSSSHPGRREVSSDDDGSPTDEDLQAWAPNPLPAGLNLTTERAAFRAANRGRWHEFIDIRGAWIGWLRVGAARSKPTHTPSRPECPIHPGQPTGSKACPQCTADHVPAPDLRALKDAS